MEAAKEYVASASHNINMPSCGFRIDQLVADMHGIAASRGWWVKPRNFGELIALIHSELSEALEGDRKSLPSDHIEGFSMVEEEFADALIRIFDTAGGMKLRLGAAFLAKCAFNKERADHDLAVRNAAGGKSY
jgi:NTP pyrophosphatase (non-canonical NTP hydrolase)